MNFGLIVAAGGGTRFGAGKPKQFLTVAGKPVLLHTILRFDAARSVDKILTVLPSDYIGQFESEIDALDIATPVDCVVGGETRHESVRLGLEALGAKDTDIVGIHDGARPTVPIQDIDATFAAAEDSGAACLVGRVFDTLKRVVDGKVVATVDRDLLRRALTPQCFRVELLRKAISDFAGGEVTDDSYLLEAMGIDVVAVEATGSNIKITEPGDLELVAGALSSGQ